MKKIFFIFFLLCLFSCNNYEQYPIEPKLTFNSFKLIYDDNSVAEKCVISIDFTDGDGDIGLSDSDTLPPYDYNLFVKYYEMQNGYLVQLINQDGDTVNFNARVPIITPSGSNKNVKGTIFDTIFINPFSLFDTIKYEIYLVDRALHKSNTIESPLISTKK